MESRFLRSGVGASNTGPGINDAQAADGKASLFVKYTFGFSPDICGQLIGKARIAETLGEGGEVLLPAK
jgi:hypothetical protein